MSGERRGTYDEDELILTLALYKTTDKRDISSSNPSVIRLSGFLEAVHSGPNGLGRSPGSIKMKMNNFLALDPDYHGTGCANVGSGDAEVWNSFYDKNFKGLAEEAIKVERRLAEGRSTIPHLFESKAAADPGLNDDVRTYLEIASIERRIFHNRILGTYNGRCCITGMAERPVILAEHIKPLWLSEGIPEERLDPSNGLCLNSFHADAFEKGLFTIDDHMRVEVSPAVIKEEQRKRTALTDWLCSYDGWAISPPHSHMPDSAYLEYHRDFVYADTSEKLRRVRSE